MKNKEGRSNDINDDTDDLDLFLKLEAVLNEETQEPDEILSTKLKLAEEFPGVFIENNAHNQNDTEELQVPSNQIAEFRKMYLNLVEQTKLLNQQKEALVKERNEIIQEKANLSKERAQIENDRMLAETKLDNIALIQLREKYENLKKQYSQEKLSWENERESLNSKIKSLLISNPDASLNESITNPQNSISDSNKVSQDAFLLSTPKQKSSRSPSPKKSTQKIQKNKISPIHSKDKSPQDNFKQTPNQINQNSKQNTNQNSKQNINQNISDKIKMARISPFKRNNINNYIFPEEKMFDPKFKLEFDYTPNQVLREEIKGDGRRLVRYRDGTKGTVFKNGTVKYQRNDNNIIKYDNNDVAIEFNDGSQAYRYSATNAIEISYPDKSVLYLFSNGQKEKHFPNGDKAILFPNHEYKMIYSNGDLEVKYPSGRIERTIQGSTIVTEPDNL